MSDAARRLERWNAKFTPELAKQTNECIYDSMSRRDAAAVTALAAMEEKAKQTLDACGVPTCMYVPISTTHGSYSGSRTAGRFPETARPRRPRSSRRSGRLGP